MVQRYNSGIVEGAPMEIQINFRDHVPIYIQLMEQIKHMIASGELQPGEQLPTVRQLAADLRVNFNTVARAYRLLDEESIISTQHGRGTFILELPSEEKSRELRRNSLARLTHVYLNEAFNLDFSPDEVHEVFDEKLQQWRDEERPPALDGI
jgi:GntR family transcriptional regulator